MATQQRDPRSGTPAARRWRAVLLAALVVTSALAVGYAARPATDTTAAAENAGLDATAAPTAAQPSSISGTLPLANATSKLAGASENDSFGAALAYGDVNGDGAPDAIVGAPLADTENGNNSGAVYVFYGPVEDANLSAERANRTLLGADAGDRAGFSVATGDVNNDSVADVVVGAPLEDAGGDAAGAAYVVYGANRSGNVSLVAANHTFRGEGPADRAGLSVGAVNRTGGDAVLVGAPGNDSLAPNAGAAYLVADAAPGTESLANATAKLAGEAANDLAGWSVASAGDFDGDGRADVVVGARRNNSTASGAGAAYVLTRNASGLVPLAAADLKLAGVDARANAGWAVAEAGDVNNDSYSDVVVGAPFNDSAAGSDAGAAYVVYGGPGVSGVVPLSEAGTALLGEAPDDNAGWAVSSAGSGDVTCDQFADVLVGAPGNDSVALDAGAAYVVAGSDAPPARRNLSAAAAKLVGEAANDSAGLAVSDTGDLTGDGDKDVLVGAPGNDSTARDAGAAYLVAGDCPDPVPMPTTTTTTKSTTTTATPDRPKNVAVSVECVGDDGVIRLRNEFGEPVEVTVRGPDDYVRTVVLDAAGSHGDTRSITGLADADYRLSAKTVTGHRAVTVNDRHVYTANVDCDPAPAPEPTGKIEDVTCEHVKVSVGNVPEQRIAVRVRFADESTTVATVETDADGDFAGRISFENPDEKTITGVQLFAGSHPASDQLLDNTGHIEVDCREPEPEPPVVRVGSPDCEALTFSNPHSNRDPVSFTVETPRGAVRGPFTLAPGETRTFEDVPAGDYRVSVETESGDRAVLSSNGASSDTFAVAACKPTTTTPHPTTTTTKTTTTTEPRPTTTATTTKTTERPTTTTTVTKTTTEPHPTTSTPTRTTTQTTVTPTTTTTSTSTRTPTTTEPSLTTTTSTATTRTTPSTTMTTTQATTTTSDTTTTQTTTSTTQTTTPTTTSTTQTTTPTTTSTTQTTTPTTTSTTTETTATPTTTETTATPTTTETTATDGELPPPLFNGCSQIILYADGTATFEVVVFNETSGQYTVVTVSTSDADETYDPGQPNFGSGIDGVLGYGFEQGGVFESGLKVVGVVDYGGSGDVNPNFNPDSGNCGGSQGGAVPGEPFDWSTLLNGEGAVSPLSGATGPDPAMAVSLLSIAGAVGLLVRGREW